MRLVCPNCDAEYEVDASVIPDTGRDVQCSNCGHAWFQLPPEVEAGIAAEEELYDAPPQGTTAPVATVPVAPAPAVPPPEPEPVAVADSEPEPPRRSIDESVLAVLREEAEREVEARKIETPPVIETQTELGLQPDPKVASGGAVARRIAKLKGVEPEPAKPQSRREMLPEIDELNSTLRSSSERRTGEAAAVSETLADPQPKRSGFRSGFTLILLIAVILTATYLMAPKLSQQFPAASGALNGYVAAVDQFRVALDGWVQSAVNFLRGLTSSAS